MTPDHDIELIRHAAHGDPFSILGVHADAQGRLWLRAMLPHATHVSVLDVSSGAQLGVDGIWVGLQRQQLAVAGGDFELVARAFGHAGQEELPDAAFAAQPHRMAPRVPGVEVADDADLRRVRRPHGEARAGHVQHHALRRAQHLERPQMGALAEQPHVELAKHRREAVGIVDK